MDKTSLLDKLKKVEEDLKDLIDKRDQIYRAIEQTIGARKVLNILLQEQDGVKKEVADTKKKK